MVALKPARNEKGAFQLSLGFIITVVFAIVLLSFGLQWLTGIFGSVTQLTDDLSAQAKEAIDNTFRTTSKSFAIFPSRHEMTADTRLIFSAGVKNTADNSLENEFLINVVPATVSASLVADTCPDKNDPITRNCVFKTGGANIETTMNSWITVDPIAFSISHGGRAFKDIIIVPAGAPAGNYFYNVVACIKGTGITDSPTPFTAANCKTVTRNWGESAQQLTLVIET